MNKSKFLPKQDHPGFLKDFQSEITILSPGRINLIGEHTDYNNGFVLPTAIDKTIQLDFRTNASEFECNVFSKTYNKNFTFDLRYVSRSSEQWENYVLGVVNELLKLGKKIKGFDCIIESNLPVGAGISSSAALECGMAFGLNQLFELDLNREKIAELSRSAEHTFVGTKCGIMDQYASILSKEGHFILLDCNNLEASYVPAHFKGHKILLLNTMVSHSLAESEYNTRRQECEKVVTIIREKYPEVTTLRDISLSVLDQYKNNLPEELFNRARYVLQENQRVLDAVEAIQKGNLGELGNLMYDSHTGLRDEYQVSCKELDFLVEITKNVDSVLGARMMGGGFGGCTINLIKEEAVEGFVLKASQAYFKEFGIELEAIPVFPGKGTYIQKSKNI